MSTRLSHSSHFVQANSVHELYPARVKGQAFEMEHAAANRQVGGARLLSRFHLLRLHLAPKRLVLDGQKAAYSVHSLNVIEKKQVGWELRPTREFQQNAKLLNLGKLYIESWRGIPAKKGDTKMKGYPNGCLKTKKLKKRLCHNSPRTLNVIEK